MICSKKYLTVSFPYLADYVLDVIYAFPGANHKREGKIVKS